MPTTSPVQTSLPPIGQQRSLLKHEKVRAALLGGIAEGRLRPGDALPTEYQLAEMMQVSRSTIRQTLGELEKEGVVRRVRGRGTFVTEQAGGESPAAKTEALAIVLPDTRSGYFPSLQHGFGGECRRTHQHMISCDTDQDIYKQSDAILQLIDKRVEGVAIVPPTTAATPPHHIRPLQDQGIPVVFCHRAVAGVKAPLVTFSGHEVGAMAGRAMSEHGHRTVAYFASSHDELSIRYEEGLRETIHQHGGTLLDEHVHVGTHTHGPVSEEHELAIEEKLKQILAGSNPPTAIMVSFDTSAESLYLQLGRLGLRVPEDISLVSFGGSWREGAVVRQLTSVTVDEAELGRQAAKLLNEIRDGSRKIDSDEEVVLPLSLSDGNTLGRIP